MIPWWSIKRRRRYFDNKKQTLHFREWFAAEIISLECKCPICGCLMIVPEKGVIYPDHVPNLATTDHIQPLSEGGSNDYYNLRVICNQCNLDLDYAFKNAHREHLTTVIKRDTMDLKETNTMSDTMKITKAILEVMKDVKGIEKNSEVGSGSYGYKGVNDQEVKQIIGKSMKENGLAIIPTAITEETQLSDWDEGGRRKQSIFTKVNTKYLLLHESGESLEIAGYGHGIDSQDKGAGKATTYALKYALLYTFLVPTGEIDDSDKTHSNDIETPAKKSAPVVSTTATRPPHIAPGRVLNITGSQCPDCNAPANYVHATSCKAIMSTEVN